jgi:hypothetical protein
LRPAVEPALVHELREQPQKAETGREYPQHALQHVPQLEVPELVRKHGFDLGRPSRLKSVSKNTMRLALPKPVK